MSVRVYISTVSSSKEIKKQQQKIQMILESKKIEVEYIDISQSEEAKNTMRELCGNEKALPPQICNGDEFCGDFGKFDEALEDENLEEFLKIK